MIDTKCRADQEKKTQMVTSTKREVAGWDDDWHTRQKAKPRNSCQTNSKTNWHSTFRSTQEKAMQSLGIMANSKW